jgi:SET domain-containing protein
MYIPQLLEIKSSKFGKGLFTRVPLTYAQNIFRFTGIKGDDAHTNAQSLEIDIDLFIESDMGYDDFLNHSCDPNCYIDFSDISLRALRRIPAGDELTFNYNTTEWDLINSRTPSSFVCDCNSDNCFGIIRGFKYLTEAQRQCIKDIISPAIRKRL